MRCFALATLTLRSPLSVRSSQPATQRSSNSADNSASGSESRWGRFFGRRFSLSGGISSSSVCFHSGSIFFTCCAALFRTRTANSMAPSVPSSTAPVCHPNFAVRTDMRDGLWASVNEDTNSWRAVISSLSMDSSSSVTKNSETNCEGKAFIAVSLRTPPFRSGAVRMPEEIAKRDWRNTVDLTIPPIGLTIL